MREMKMSKIRIKELMKICIKGLFALILIAFLIIEVFLTSSSLEAETIIIYTAIITSLCWVLVFWIFTKFSLFQRLLALLIYIAFLYMYFLNTQVGIAHGVQGCLETGKVWDYDKNICRDDCLTWNKKEGCVPLEEPQYQFI